MEKKLTETATIIDTNMRLDAFLAKHLSDLSRTYIKKLSEEGNIIVNGKQEKVSYKIKFGDEVTVTIPKEEETEIKAENIKFDIIYEDEDIIVVNKPRGMVVHPAVGNQTGTLVNGLLYKADKLSQINGVVRPGIVHRIDKETSGVLVCAKNDNAHKKLSEQLKEHSITRKYIAIVNGKIEKDVFTINAPIARSPKDRKKMAIVETGRKAITHIKVLNKNDRYSYIEVTLETGRTHQIRVHMSAIGHSLVGDTVYGNKKTKFNITGQALHAMVLGFIHPSTEKYVEFVAPIPEDFKEILKETELEIN